MRALWIALALLLCSCDVVSGLSDFSTRPPIPDAGGAGGTGGAGGGGGEGGEEPAGPVLFSAVYGDIGETRGLAVTSNSQEEVVFAGTANADIDLGGGLLTATPDREIIVGRVDNTGTHIASRLFGGAGVQEMWDAAIAADDDIIIAGRADTGLFVEQDQLFDATSGFILKLAREDLSVVWAGQILGDATVTSVDVAPDGSVYLCGQYEGVATLPGGQATSDGVDGFVSKLAADGTFIRTLRISRPNMQRAERCAATSDGGVVVGLRFAGDLDLGTGLVTSTAQDAMILKLDSAGVTTWTHHLAGVNNERIRGVAASDNGKIGIVGTYSGTVVLGTDSYTAEGNDMFVAVLDDAGASSSLDWGRSIDGTDETSLMRSPIAFDAEGNLLVTGTISGAADFGGGNVLSSVAGSRDIVVAKLSPAGDHLWSYAWGGADEDMGAALAVDLNGNSWVVGTFQTAIDFNVSYAVDSDRSMFLLQLAP
jgi:hypothetical protein